MISKSVMITLLQERVMSLEIEALALESNYKKQNEALTKIYKLCGGVLEDGDTAGNFDLALVIQAVEKAKLLEE